MLSLKRGIKFGQDEQNCTARPIGCIRTVGQLSVELFRDVTIWIFKASKLYLVASYVSSSCLKKAIYCCQNHLIVYLKKIVYTYIYVHTHKWAELECISLFLWSSPNAECCHLLLISPPHVGCLGDTQFCFRFRRSSGRKASLCCFLDHLDRDLPVYLKVGNEGIKVILAHVCVYIRL